MLVVPIEIKDNTGSTSSRQHAISFPALIKHIGVAGQGFAPTLDKFLGSIGAWVHFRHYLKWDILRTGRFSRPALFAYDPSRQAEFSRLAGLGFADYFAKRLHNAQLTVTYEAALKVRGHPVTGRRPDLLCFNDVTQFALESKGSGAFGVPLGRMAAYKTQSKQGRLSVSFSIACVTYNMFSKARVKYHDPVLENAGFDDETFRSLRADYWEGLRTFVERATVREINAGDQRVFEIPLLNHLDAPLRRRMRELSLLLVPEIVEPILRPRRPRGPSQVIVPWSDSEELYLDSDGVGVRYAEAYPAGG
jgi:hypothetical protein